MKKYEIMTANFEFRFSIGRPIPSQTADEIFDTYLDQADLNPHREAVYTDEAEALKAFSAEFGSYGYTREEKSYNGFPLLVGQLAYLEANIYDDDDDEFIQGDSILAFAAAPYEDG